MFRKKKLLGERIGIVRKSPSFPLKVNKVHSSSYDGNQTTRKRLNTDQKFRFFINQRKFLKSWELLWYIWIFFIHFPIFIVKWCTSFIWSVSSNFWCFSSYFFLSVSAFSKTFKISIVGPFPHIFDHFQLFNVSKKTSWTCYGSVNKLKIWLSFFSLSSMQLIKSFYWIFFILFPCSRK